MNDRDTELMKTPLSEDKLNDNYLSTDKKDLTLDFLQVDYNSNQPPKKNFFDMKKYSTGTLNPPPYYLKSFDKLGSEPNKHQSLIKKDLSDLNLFNKTTVTNKKAIDVDEGEQYVLNTVGLQQP